MSRDLARAAVFNAFADAAHQDSAVEDILMDLCGAQTVEDVQDVLDRLNELLASDMESPATLEECVQELGV